MDHPHGCSIFYLWSFNGSSVFIWKVRLCEECNLIPDPPDPIIIILHLQLWWNASVGITILEPLCFPRGRRVQTTGQNWTNLVKNVEIVKFHDHIWNHNEKCIQISTNMPGIGSLIREISVEIPEMWEAAKRLLLSKTKSSVLSVKWILRVSGTSSESSIARVLYGHWNFQREEESMISTWIILYNRGNLLLLYILTKIIWYCRYDIFRCYIFQTVYYVLVHLWIIKLNRKQYVMLFHSQVAVCSCTWGSHDISLGNGTC